MFTFVSFVSFLALSAIAPSVHALPSHGLERRIYHKVPRQFQERDYKADADRLEPYEDYAKRYNIFKCKDKHDTPFFKKCCHPLLKGQNEDALPDTCFEDVPCDPSTSSTHPKPSSSLPLTQHTHTRSHTMTDPPVSTHHATSYHHTTTSSIVEGGSWRSNGVATYYEQGGNAGACGKVHPDGAKIIAMNIFYYGDPNAVSSYCGKVVEIVNLNNQRVEHAIVGDVCPTCHPDNSLDLSVGTFQALDENLGDGEFPIKWRILN